MKVWVTIQTSKVLLPAAKVMAEGEGNLECRWRRERMNTSCGPEINHNNGLLFILLTSSWFPLRKRG